MNPQYQKISDEDICAAGEADPQKALLMLLANETADEAEQRAAGRKPHEPTFRASGWSLAIETPQGVVGLWSCWLQDRFYLGYPRQAAGSITDAAIMEILGVEYAQAVLDVSATAVSREDYTGEYKDPDKPLARNSAGQVVAYRGRGPRLWARFYGPRVKGEHGRVWVDRSDRDQTGHGFKIVKADSAEGLKELWYGHDASEGISTYPFTHWNAYAPDGPTTDPEAVQPYRDKFLALASVIAQRMGGAVAVNIDYGFVLVPEQFAQLGYSDIAWLKGTSGVRRGYGNDVVRAKRLTARGEEALVLKSGNSLVPWSTIRRVPCADPTVETLRELLTF